MGRGRKHGGGGGYTLVSRLESKKMEYEGHFLCS